MRRLCIALSWVAFACKPESTPSAKDGGDDPPAKQADDPEAKAKQAEAKVPAGPEPKLVEPLGEEREDGDEPPLAVALPPAPDFGDVQVPDKYPDGVWSIAGLRNDFEANVRDGEAGKEVEVRGYVGKIYVPPECPEGEVCPPPKQPHVWITDTAEERGLKRAMMVVNYRFTIPEWDAKRWRDEPEVVMEKGKQYTFKGKFKQFSDTGFAHAEGLLEFVAYHPHDPDTGAELSEWVYPPGSYWHPLEIVRQEEDNAALMKKAEAAARAEAEAAARAAKGR